MAEEVESSRRRHILSSINPDEPRKRARRAPIDEPSPLPKPSPTPDPPVEDGSEPDTTRPRRTRLKLKDHRPRHRSRERDDHDISSHRSHRRHRRHRRRHRSPTPPNPYEPASLDPEAAFRESLFDAMADDEGAAFWEGVYGQPIHGYTADKVGPQGELERMTDEEYATHVRQKMWEKTHAGLLEERARREEERKRKEKEKRHSRKLQDEMDRSLRRGEERRLKKRWEQTWSGYANGWAHWDGAPETLPWPVDGGQRSDIAEKNVRDFFVHGLGLDEIGETSFVSKLKDERVRWHPDKIQQRLGGRVDSDVMKDVTAVFQIIDRLWSETRSKKT
ncbi:hypothetical protein HJFPF1_03515 [Paramyrothecium foliicola]|nr:hypothetical protein HJFPF1_03515 [Paramyrothecium foliicola]